jgi:predicted esterase
VAPAVRRGQPRVFISHGRDDPVLPIDACSRQIVPQMRQAGFQVEYLEFEGGHAIPPTIAEAAVAWFAGTAGH